MFCFKATFWKLANETKFMCIYVCDDCGPLYGNVFKLNHAFLM